MRFHSTTLTLALAHCALAALTAPARAATFDIPEVEIFSITNVDEVFNNPTAPSEFTLDQPRTVARIRTYHWNNTQGVTPGEIWLLDDMGSVAYGPWPATGSPGQGGVPNAYWDAAPDIEIAPGNYQVMDSDPATWSHNGGTGGRGMTWIYASDSITTPDPPTPAELGVGDSVASVAWKLDGDVRQSPSVWAAPTPGGVIETTLEIPTTALSGGVHHLTLAGSSEEDGAPNSFGHLQHFVFAVAKTPPPAQNITALRWSIGGDPRSGGTQQAATTPGTMIEVTVDIPTSSLTPGAHTISLVAADSESAQGHVIATPFLLKAPTSTPSISALEARVIDSAGDLAAGPMTQATTGSPTVFDGSFDWPSFRLRESGNYQILIAPLGEDGLPGRFAKSAEFSIAIPPYAAAIYAEFWPPEDFPAGVLDFGGDANNDGVANGTAFALGLSPSDKSATANLPSAVLESDAMLFTFRQRAGGTGIPGEGYTADGVEYRVELSSDLSSGSWLNAAARISLLEPPSDNGDGTETITLRIQRSAADADFARLRTAPSHTMMPVVSQNSGGAQAALL